MIKTFFIALLFFCIIDVFWIYFVATPMYKLEVPSLMELKVMPAIFFYIIFLLGLIFFVINPNQGNTLFNVFLIGALWPCDIWHLRPNCLCNNEYFQLKACHS